MKVLRVITRLNVGGPSRQISVLNSNLPEYDFQQVLVSGIVEANESEIDVSGLGNLIRIPQLRRSINPVQDFKSLLALMRIIKQYNPDIIHTHLSKAWVLTLLAAKVVKSKAVVIHTFHGHILENYYGRLMNSIVIKVHKIAAKNTNLIIAVGERVRKELLDFGVGLNSRFEVVYPGIFPTTSREPLRIHNKTDELQLIFIGRLESVKQPLKLLEIASELEKLQTPYRFVVLGDGSFLRQLIEASKSYNFKFMGWQTNVEQFLLDSDLLVLCSKSEGTPIAILEAARCAVPVISSSVGSIGDMIDDGETGFLVGPNAIDYALKIDELHRNREFLADVGLSSQRELKVRFSVEKFIAQHIQMYASLSDNIK
jgi:glycosyltransferase involved in cell wall biosynthesis